MQEVAIIGGGAAGLFTALYLKYQLIKEDIDDVAVIVYERLERTGKKLLATGNGRCNLSNSKVNKDKYNNPEFVKSFIKQFGFKELKEFLSEMGLYIITDEVGRAYPHSETATPVLDVLRTKIKQYTTINDYCTWKIEITNRGNFKFSCKALENSNEELVLAFTSYENGARLIQNEYQYNDPSDTYCYDEWTFEFFKDSAFIALPEKYDRSSFFATTIDYLENIGYINNFDNHAAILYGMTEKNFLYYMSHSKITLVRTHGSKTSISLTGDSLTRDELLALPSDTLAYSELIIYGSCLTASGGEYDANLVTATVSAGARTVIGFENYVSSSACNKWCTKFFEYYALYYNNDSKTIYNACYDTDSYMKNDPYYEGYADDGSLVSLRNFVIAGEKTFPR